MRRVVVGALAFVLCAPTVWAAPTPAHEAAESPVYGRKFGGMLGRGLINLSTCFVDLLVNVVQETRTGPPLVGTLVGLGKGVGCTTLRALSGAVDVTTFWVPGFNGFAVSDSYENCLAVGSAAMTPEAPAEDWPSHSPESYDYPELEPHDEPARVPPMPPAPEPEKPTYRK